MKKKYVLTTILAALAITAVVFSLKSRGYDHQIIVAKKKLYVDIARTPQKMQQGLSGRTGMAENQGMLFDFEAETTPTFWMKDMNFALDFIWVKNNKIIFITYSVPPPKSTAEKLQLYSAPSPIDSVLEVNAGWAGENEIKIGDEVKF
jgi:uncharacterized membrane protein (UPF0127 family)